MFAWFIEAVSNYEADLLAGDGLYSGNRIIASGPNLVACMQRLCLDE